MAHLALGDAVRPYHYFMLHFTDTESQATNHAISPTPTPTLNLTPTLTLNPTPTLTLTLTLSLTLSQATNHGADDAWNRANLPGNGSTPPWNEFVPRDVDTAAWRGNSFKRAIARIGDQINGLMDSFANDDTVLPLTPNP